jgi:Protein of unknown function (DUF1186)
VFSDFEVTLGRKKVQVMSDLIRPTTIRPLQHQVFESLFDSLSSLPNDVLEKILNLPRQSAIEDLVSVIQRTVRRFDEEGEDWGCDFSVVHALLLLSHFRAEEKLPFLLALFNEGDDWVEQLIYDFLTEDLHLVFYHCGQNQVPLLKDYVLYFDYDNKYIKGGALDAMVLIARKNPDRKLEIQQTFHDLFDFVLSQQDEELIETDDFVFLCTDLTGVVQGFGDQRFLEKVKMLYEKDLIEEMVFGPWENYQKDFNEINPISLYDDIRDWYRENGEL